MWFQKCWHDPWFLTAMKTSNVCLAYLGLMQRLRVVNANQVATVNEVCCVVWVQNSYLLQRYILSRWRPCWPSVAMRLRLLPLGRWGAEWWLTRTPTKPLRITTLIHWRVSCGTACLTTGIALYQYTCSDYALLTRKLTWDHLQGQVAIFVWRRWS